MARTAGSHSDITGPRIEKVALSLFARHGYAAVSMRQIASEVGVQVGALYNYIPDKQSLLVELMRCHLKDLLEAYEDNKAIDPAERLRNFVDFHISFHADRPEAVFIAYMELRNLSPDNFRTIEVLRQRYEDRLETILIDGIADGSFDIADTKITTLALIAMLTGITTWFSTKGRLSLEEVQEHYWTLVRRAVGLTASK